MSSTGAQKTDNELIAALKQDISNAAKSGESQATKEHIAGAQGKLASAISQSQGDSDTSTGGQRLARDIDRSGGEVDRDAVQESLRARADAKIEEQYGEGDPDMDKGSEASRLKSAADQYDLAREGKQEKDQKKMTGDMR